MNVSDLVLPYVGLVLLRERTLTRFLSLLWLLTWHVDSTILLVIPGIRPMLFVLRRHLTLRKGTRSCIVFAVAMVVRYVLSPIRVYCVSRNVTTIDSKWRRSSCRRHWLRSECLIWHHDPIDAIKLNLVLLVQGVKIDTWLSPSGQRWLVGLSRLGGYIFELMLSAWNFLSRICRHSGTWHWPSWVSAFARLTNLRLQVDLGVNLLWWVDGHADVRVLTLSIVTLHDVLLWYEPSRLGLHPVFLLYCIHGSCGGGDGWSRLRFNKCQWIGIVWIYVDGLHVLLLVAFVGTHDFFEILWNQYESGFVGLVHFLVADPRQDLVQQYKSV